MSDCIIIYFAPDRWGTLERFRHFYAGTYTFTPNTQHVLSGAASHFHKARILLQIAREHAAKLPEDRAQLEKHDYTPAQRGRDLSALYTFWY